MNPGGRGCSELRSHHCTLAWVTRAKLCLKKREEKERKETKERKEKKEREREEERKRKEGQGRLPGAGPTEPSHRVTRDIVRRFFKQESACLTD